MKLSRQRILFSTALVILVAIALISACNYIGIGGINEPPPPGPAQLGILAPVKNTDEMTPSVLAGSPVQIQSAHQGSISRVELSVQGQDQPQPTLLRADAPSNGVVVQEWIPDRPGLFTVTVAAFTADNTVLDSYTIQVEVTDSAAVAVAPARSLAETGDQGAAFLAPTATPTSDIVGAVPTIVRATPVTTTPEGQLQAESDVSIAVAEATPSVMEVATATPIPRYPPPPPMPGVPYGPTQKELPALIPPVGDAAKKLGVFTTDNTRRVLISEPDDVAAQVVAGTTIFRAWRVQNIGTNTWGPGYELAFYGGRSMGSGGVAFEATFPGEPARRNVVLDRNRLVVPEGKPNQTAVVEVMLNAPVTPGIHQSYWRLRNPQGVFFGPIMGVTMEVVRECEFNVYGAPVINRFDILGVGNVYQPTDPALVDAEFGENITLDWDIINADNFDIVIEDPTGEIESVSTPDQRGRVTFPVNELGQYTVTLYADNGPCTVPATVIINVFPPEEDRFRLIIIHSGGAAGVSSSSGTLRTSSTVQPGNIIAEWEHFDENTDDFVLLAALFEERAEETCPELFGYHLPCYSSSEWVQTDSVTVDVGGEGDAQGAASVSNIERSLCRSLSSPDVNYEIHYRLRAGKNGSPAKPEFSNLVVDNTRPCDSLRPFLKDEIEGAFNK